MMQDITSRKIPQPINLWWAWIAGCCIILIIFIVLLIGGIYLFSGNSSSEIKYTTSVSPLDMIDMELSLENELKLTEVSLTEATGEIIEIRTAMPYNVASEAVTAGAIYTMATLQPMAPSDWQTYRVVLTVNGIDSLVYESKSEDLKSYLNGQLSLDEFTKKTKITNLLTD